MKNQKGFTLIELMIEVAIIGILLTTIAPTIEKYLNERKVEQAKQEQIDKQNETPEYLRQYGFEQ